MGLGYTDQRVNLNDRVTGPGPAKPSFHLDDVSNTYAKSVIFRSACETLMVLQRVAHVEERAPLHSTNRNDPPHQVRGQVLLPDI
ncbi:hypothetical protein OH781_40265 [Streptomyces sp. NBC_01550]|uniref:hypothetical protein n=1 Tax=Streptomyces sp. NBC_01550 TaxID=2975875 RepID=UPI00386CCE35